jgi:hypothetical protein
VPCYGSVDRECINVYLTQWVHTLVLFTNANKSKPAVTSKSSSGSGSDGTPGSCSKLVSDTCSWSFAGGSRSSLSKSISTRLFRACSETCGRALRFVWGYGCGRVRLPLLDH